MAQAGYAKTINANEERKKELQLNFPIGTTLITKTGKEISISGLWGDRCVIGTDSVIYNVECDFGYKFNYNQLKR